MTPRRLAPVLFGLAIGTAALALSSSPRKLEHGEAMQPRSQEALDGGTWQPQPDAPTEPQLCKLPDGGLGGTCSVKYYGGAVIPNVKAYAVFWTSAVSSETRSQIGGWFTAATNSDWMDWLAEYRTDITVQAGSAAGTAGTQQLIGRGVYGGGFTINPATVTGCNGGNDHQLFGSQIQSELAAQITAGHLPVPDLNTIYMVYFPPGCHINEGSPANPNPTGDSCRDFCAFHGTIQESAHGIYYFGVVPDFSPGSGCDLGCTSGVTTFEGISSASAHELVEAVTDAQVGLSGDTLGPPLAWYDENAGETGDMCNQAHDQIVGLADGVSYTVQQMYSERDYANNPATGCVTTRFEPNDFKVFMNPNLAVLPPGTTLHIPVVTAATSGSPGPLALSLANLPGGVTGGFDNSAPTPGSTVQLTLSASASAAQRKDAVVVIRGSAGGVVHTAGLLLQVGNAVVGANDFALSVQPPSAQLSVGQPASFTVSTSVAAGAPESIALSLSGLPSGIAGSFSPASVTAGQSSTLTVTATASAAGGSHGFSVVGRSASVPGGHQASAQVVVSSAPTVSFSSPASGSRVSGNVTVSASATPGAGSTLSSVVVKVDGVQLASGTSSASGSWNTTTVSNGQHQLVATATDADQGQGQANLTVNVVNGPSTSLSAPAEGATVSGSVPLNATAAAASGSVLSSLAIAVDGTQVASGSAAPLSVAWDSSKVPNGPHVVTSIAGDADGLTTTSPPLHVTVSNQSGGCSSTGDPLWAPLGLLGLFLVRANRARVRTRPGRAGPR